MRSTVNRKYDKCNPNVTSNMLPVTEKYTAVRNTCPDRMSMEKLASDETLVAKLEEVSILKLQYSYRNRN